MELPKYPRTFEINTRVWIKRFGANAALKDVPLTYFEELRQKGIDVIWLMGIWQTSKSSVEKYCFEPELISDYNYALPDWHKEDVIGSPYSINEYKINPELGTLEDLRNLRKKFHQIGLCLMLDFIPNHFSAESILLKTNPEIFLEVDEELFKSDPYTFFRSPYHQDRFFTHGRDPFFPPWKDTAQVNFFSLESRKLLTEILLDLAELCDGVRCDMAMLPLNNTFQNTWVGVLNKAGQKKPASEFWNEAIKEVKKSKPDFFFVGEAYWNLEWDLQQLGFDFTYDKKLTDRLEGNDVFVIKDHFNADDEYQDRSVRFLENHDEKRAITKFGKEKSLAAATVISASKGMILYYDGQIEGKKIKLPLQLGREPQERVSKRLSNYYDRILSITNCELFKSGSWKIIYPEAVSSTDKTSEKIICFIWLFKRQVRIIAVNYSDESARCRIKVDLPTDTSEVILDDLLNSISYKRSVTEMKEKGLFIELKAYNSHIFATELLD